MKTILSLVAISLMILGCSKEESKTLGYWISDDNSYILKIENDQSFFTFLNRSAAQSKQVNNCAHLEITQTSVTLNCDLTKNKDFKMVVNEKDQLVTTREDMPGFLKRAPNLEISELTGLWKDQETNGVGHTIYITKRTETGYDLETFDLNKSAKLFNYYKDDAIETSFTQGFIFTETSTEGDYTYYVIEKGEDWYSVVDQTGYAWAFQSYEGDMKKELIDQGYSQNN